MVDQKKGFLSTLRNLVVDDVPDAAAPPAAAPPAASAPTVPVAYVKSAADQAARQRLEESIAKSAPPGYGELADTISSLSDSIPDEASRFRAAMKLAKKRGHSVEDILGDVDKCIGILEAKGREFQDEMKHQIDQKVGARQTSVQNLDASIKSKQEQIAALQQEVSQLSEQRGTESASIATQTAKINAVSEGFAGAYDEVMEQLVERRKKIDTYGKAAQS